MLPLNYMFYYANIAYLNTYCSRPFLQSVELLLANIAVAFVVLTRVMDLYHKEMATNQASKILYRKASFIYFIEGSKDALVILLACYGPQ